MKDNIKKSLKRLLKRKVKITLGIIIAFMITGVVSYSNDDVISESVTVKINSNGIYNVGVIESLENFEIIVGSNNGIYNYRGGQIISLENFGIIAGNNGNGICNSNTGRIESLANFGIIAGSTEAIKNEGTIINQENYGLLINGAGTDNVTVNAGTGGENDIALDREPEDKRFIINTVEKNEDYEKLKNEQAINIEKLNSKLNGNTNYKISDNSFKNLILNGYGTTLFVDGDLSLDNSIINGGVDKTSATIKGSNNIDNLTLTNGTIINGNIDLDKGNDNLTLDDKTQINGDLLGGDGFDTLTFNSNGASTFSEDSEEKNINIFHSISEFENINIGTKVTLFEDTEVTEADNITIQKDGNLILRIDSTNGNSHALSGNKGTISSEGGKLLLALNGIGEGETINFGDTSLDETMKGNEEGLKEITIDTISLLHNIKKINANSVKVTTVSDIPYVNNINYNQLNKIYQSMRITDQVKEFNITDDKTLTEFTKYLNDIYAGIPYSYSTEISRKTLTMFDEIAISKDLNPDLKSWAIYGGLTHIDGGNKNTFFGKGYYTYDVGSIDIDADIKIYGGYAKAEYGKSENFTTG
ncbi:MAG: autotransporter domain-containing protein, partial [Fusobacterium perfoetens]|nr:autotransporter domain-containing protein [Fusobacterium perfoetens]